MAVNNNHPIVSFSDKHPLFPPTLQDTRIHPPCKNIHVRGNTLFYTLPCVAIVGTRKSSLSGNELARTYAYELAIRGWCVVSGLAYGIDAAAHQGALEARGKTCAVLAHGLDAIHPRAHTRLATHILDNGGTLLSEYACGTEPRAYHFIHRNRIISALCDVVIVIEAPYNSGAVHTGMYALAQNKKLFISIGSPIHPLYYRGSYKLIRCGGRLISSFEDICDDLSLQKNLSPISPQQLTTLSPSAQSIFSFLQKEGRPCDVDTIIQRCTLSPQDTLSALAELVLERVIIENAVGKYGVIHISKPH